VHRLEGDGEVTSRTKEGEAGCLNCGKNRRSSTVSETKALGGGKHTELGAGRRQKAFYKSRRKKRKKSRRKRHVNYRAPDLGIER